MRSKDKATEIFKNAPVPKAVLYNIIPSIISMIMVLVYNLADTFFIGLTKNAYMVAAVSIATPVFLIFMAVGLLFGIGGTSMISRLLGEGNREKAKHVSSFCFWTGLAIGILCTVLIWIFIDPICRLVGASEDTFEYVKSYIEIVAIGVPFLIISNSFSNIVRSDGNAQKAMFGMILGNLVNIVLDPILILGFDMNIAGAAIATAIGNIAAMVYYIMHMISNASTLSIHLKDYKANDRIATGVLTIGVPASVNTILMSLSNILLNNMMKQHGDMAIAGLGVAMKVNMIVVMLLIGLGTGIQPLLGYCYGARNKDRFLSVLKFSILLSLSLSLIMTVLCYLAASPMVSAFLTDQTAHTFGMKFARTLIISGPILGVLFVFINTLQAMGAAFPSLILSVSRQGLVFVPILTTFNYIFHTERTLVLAQPITDYVTVGIAILLFLHTYNRTLKKFPSVLSKDS